MKAEKTTPAVAVENSLQHGSKHGLFAIRGDLDGHKLDQKVLGEQFLGLFVGDEEFLMAVDCIQEIVLPQFITRVPRAHAALRGVINLRGTITPVICLRQLLNLEPKELDDDKRIIVLNNEAAVFSILADSITYVINIPEQQKDKFTSQKKERKDELISEIARVEQRVLPILDLQSIMRIVMPKVVPEQEEAS